MMNPLLCRLVPLLLAAITPAVAATSSPTAGIEVQITRLESMRIAALLNRDLAALDKLYADDMIYIHSAGRIDSKKGYMALLAGGTLNYATLRYDPPAVIHVINSDTAIVTGRANIETRNKAGELTKRALTTATVYVRSGDTWKIVSYQATPVQP